MEHIFYEDFDKLLREYGNPETREEKLIKHRLDSIVALYENCSVEEREFADEITLEFSRIIAILKSRHQKEIFEITQKHGELQNEKDGFAASGLSFQKCTNGPSYEYDYEVLEAFYDHFRKPEQLPYWELENFEFENDEQYKKLVNLTMRDYTARIKTFANKYLCEIFPKNIIPNVIHGENAEDYESYEPVVFVYNNLEVILAKFEISEGAGKKQRLNIRSALRKLNEFKQAQERMG